MILRVLSPPFVHATGTISTFLGIRVRPDEGLVLLSLGAVGPGSGKILNAPLISEQVFGGAQEGEDAVDGSWVSVRLKRTRNHC